MGPSAEVSLEGIGRSGVKKAIVLFKMSVITIYSGTILLPVYASYPTTLLSVIT